jgi:transposase
VASQSPSARSERNQDGSLEPHPAIAIDSFNAPAHPLGPALTSLRGAPYAPELNPVEYLWDHWNRHQLPNVCAHDIWQISEGARRTLRRLRRLPRLITAFWKQASLFD